MTAPVYKADLIFIAVMNSCKLPAHLREHKQLSIMNVTENRSEKDKSLNH